LKTTGRTKKLLNLGSYNYLGFAENSGSCTKSVVEAIKTESISTCSSRIALGTSKIHRELETLVAQFLGKEDAVVFGMGYATNSTSLPGIIGGKECLIISDSNNHASLVSGMRRSGAVVRQFQHNDTAHLEEMLREAILQGQVSRVSSSSNTNTNTNNNNNKKEHKPWDKILIVVEGIYSMEGAILPLPEIVRLKKKYNAYLYIDEAHSIGALGNKGGGVCDYYGVNTADIDILMGTFTKSFGSAGGYIASTKSLVKRLNVCSFASVYDTSMSIPCTMQVLSSLKVIMGLDGTDEGQTRLRTLRDNTNYFRKRMREIGFRVMGNEDSPVVPVMIHLPSTMTAFCRMCQDNGIGCVVASYPATPVFLCRARFCISASHTIEGLEVAIKSMEKLGDICAIRYDLNKTFLNPQSSVIGKFHEKVVDKTSPQESTHKNGYTNGKIHS
jgi:serine palmitoyltransferase